MGLDAKVSIWVGVKADAFKPGLDEHLETIYAGEAIEGYGTVLFHHDWDDGPREFDPQELQQEINEHMPRVKRILEAFGLTPGVWLQTDFS